STYTLQVDLDAYVRRTGRSLRRFFADLEAHGTLQAPRLSLPDHDLGKGLPAGPLGYECQYASALPRERLADQLQLQPAEIKATGEAPEEPAAEAVEPPAAKATAAGPVEADRPSTVRISVQILDRLMSLAG